MGRPARARSTRATCSATAPQPRAGQAGPGQTAHGQTAESSTQKKNPFNYGTLPAIKPDANPQVKAVVEAIRQGNHPERVSVLVRPQPFDAKAYQTNPAAYLEVVEPGRVFQTAQPGPACRGCGPSASSFIRWSRVSRPRCGCRPRPARR